MENGNGKSGDEAVPGVIFRVSQQVGQNRQMEMQFAIPLDMTPKDLNRYIDKCTAVLERQNEIGILNVTKATLAQAKAQLQANREQRANYESKCRLEWVVSNRKGDFRPTESQKAQLTNWDTTTANLMENLIPKYEKDISELERRINEGV